VVCLSIRFAQSFDRSVWTAGVAQAAFQHMVSPRLR
jgi:hypothetical protein